MKLFTIFLFLGLPIVSQAQHMIHANTESITPKDLFLCSCISEGFKKDSLLNKDTSGQLIMEYALQNSKHSYNYMSKVSLLGKQVAKSFPITPFGTRSIFLGCIEYYKSKELQIKLKEFEFNDK